VQREASRLCFDTDIDDVTEADFIFGPKIPDAASLRGAA
jgi:hypothetical protein